LVTVIGLIIGGSTTAEVTVWIPLRLPPICATVTIPIRFVVPVFACSVTVTVPLLLPLVGLTEIHDALSLTLQLTFELTETV